MDNHPTFWKTHAKKFYITIGTLSVAFVLGGMMVIPLFDNRQSVLSDIVDNNPTLPSLAGTFESSEILGFEYLDSGAVIHVWNTFDDYYFNNTRMEQFSNHYEEYWTKNIFKLVYDKNGVWETIFRSDTDLVSDYNVSFNCVSDSFINITVSGNISWKQYDIHLGVHYYIEPWDENLTVVPFAKNIGSKDISETLGLAWEMQNIQINNDTSNNFFYLQQNASYWNDYDLHNSSLDNSYDNLTYWYIDNHTTNHWGWKPRAIFWIRNGNESNWFNKQLYLDWNETLDYELVVKHETGQYNSPVTLFITG